MPVIQDMRPLICLAFATVALVMTGCRAKKQVSSQSTERATTEMYKEECHVESEQLSTTFNNTEDMELAGITIEYFTPDSASQTETLTKRVTVESAKSHRDIEAASVKEYTVVVHDTVMVQTQAERSDIATKKIERGSGLDWTWIVAVILMSIVSAIFGWMIYDSKKHGNLT